MREPVRGVAERPDGVGGRARPLKGSNDVDFRELRLTLWRYAPVGIAAFAACMLLGMAAAYLPAKTYVTTAVVLIDPGGPSGPTTPTTASVGQMNYALPSLQEKAQARSLQEAATDDVPEELRDVPVRISALAENSVLKIEGRGPSAEAAQAWTNAVAKKVIAGTDPMVVFRLSLLDEAPLPVEPVSPKSKPIMIGAFFFGTIAAFFSTVAARRLVDSSDSAAALRERGVTVLGEIPQLRGLRRARASMAKLVDEESPRELVDALELIRTNLEIQLMHRKAAAVAVVSAQPRTGRSTVAAGVAVAFAGVGRDVVVIEADLRNPSLPDKLGVNAGRGLGGMAVLGDPPQVQATAYPHLALLSAGVPAGRAADVVSTTLPRAITELGGSSTLLVIDTPAQADAPEAGLAAALAGAVVLVIGPKPEDYLRLGDELHRIEACGAELLGVVVNRVSLRRFRRAHRANARQSRSGAFTIEQVLRQEPGPEVIDVSEKPETRPAALAGKRTKR